MKENKIIEIGKNINKFLLGAIIGVIIGIIFTGLFSTIISCPSRNVINLEDIKSNACSMLIRIGCNNYSTSSIPIRNFDANGDGIKDSRDTFLELCKNYYGVNTDSECKKVCDCS